MPSRGRAEDTKCPRDSSHSLRSTPTPARPGNRASADARAPGRCETEVAPDPGRLTRRGVFTQQDQRVGRIRRKEKQVAKDDGGGPRLTAHGG